MEGRPDSPGERVCERALVWHLGQFRLCDHAALLAASRDARMVFPLVVKDERDPLSALRGYDAAVRSLARGYAALGAPLLYLEGKSEEKVVDAARDARADYVYVLERPDVIGRALLEGVCEELALWGFCCRVFHEEDKDEEEGAAQGPPASLSGQRLPGEPLPSGPLWEEEERAPDEALRLGLLSPRLPGGLPAVGGGR